MKALIIVIFVFLINNRLSAENHPLESYLLSTSVQNQGMGSRICSYQEDDMNQICFSVQMPYNLKTLAVKTLDLQFKIPHNSMFKGTLLQTGDEAYNQTLVKIGINKHLSESIDLGVHLSNLFERQGTSNTYNEVFGTIYGRIQTNENTILSFLIGNFTGANLKSKTKTLESDMAFFSGCEYRWNSLFKSSAEIGLNTCNSPTLNLGLSYQLVPAMQLYGGYQLNPRKSTWGLQVKNSSWKALYAGSWHPILGVSSSCSLQFSW